MSDGKASKNAPKAMPNLRGGAMIMKSVSLFLASGRRVSSVRRRNESGGKSGDDNQKKARRPRASNMDGRGANKLTPKQIESLKRKTHFTKVELEALYQIYRKLVSSAQPIRKLTSTKPYVEGIDRTMFREILYSTFDMVTEETLAERLWVAWESSGSTGNTGAASSVLRLENWLIGLSVFLKGTINEKIALCFRVYDLNSDGYITKDEIFLLLKNSLIKQPGDEDPDEGVRELADLALRKLDIDQDGKISLEDYRIAIAKDPLLLEAFGQCLPTQADCQTFLETLQH